MGKSLLLSASFLFCCVMVFSEGRAADATAGAAQAAAASRAKVDLVAAAKIYQKSCRACHGNKAQGASSYPRLSDKDAKYIASKLKRYRAGERFGPNSVLMIQHAKKLSDQDIASLSTYVTTAFD